MKAAKRFLSMLLTLCMLLSLLPSTVFAANSNVPFTDVKETDWFYDAVGYVYENGMMSGTGNNQFSPNVTTTRGMIVTILYRLEGSPAVSTASFDDVAAGEYYANGVSWAAANGVVSGYGNNLFGPNDPITREQTATILYRYAQYKEYETVVTGDVSSFTDGTSVSSYAVEPMNWAVGTGLLSGVGNNMINPTGNATRAEAATILTRYCKEFEVQLPGEDTPLGGEATCTVTFAYNYGNKGTYETAEVNVGETVDKPSNPSRSGYSFAGWYTKAVGGEKFDFDTEITENITLYAQWLKIVVDELPEDPSDDSAEDGELVVDTADDDGDSVPNALEDLLGSSNESDDTDGDGIDDYTEIYLIGSDPIVDDSAEDMDNDGLTNYDEVTFYGTSASKVDTDLDGLTDGNEINIYGTDPLVYDTDGDGVCDGREIELGTDPMTADRSFQISQNAPNNGDSVSVSVEIELSGEQVDTLEVEAVDNSSFFPKDMPGYLGMAYDFSVEGEFKTAIIHFEFDAAILENGADPAIFYFNEEDQTLEELETTIEGNVASAVVEHFSKYILIDRTIYYRSFTWEDVWDAEGAFRSVEIVLVIDDSGSMSSNDGSNQRLAVAQNLIDKLPEDSKIGIVWFASSTNTLTPELLTDRNAAKAYLTTAYFQSSGGTYMYNAIDRAFSLFESTEDNVLKMMVVLSDGQTSDTSKHSAAIATAQENNVRIYTVGLGSSTSYFTNYLKPLAGNTDGAFYLASNADELASIYDDINKKIDLEADADGDGIPDYYEDNMIAFNGIKIALDKNNPDTDGDGLMDGEEIEVELIYNEDKTQVYIKGKMLSDPSLTDTDFDGITDYFDNAPQDNYFPGELTTEQADSNVGYSFDYRWFFEDSTVYNTKLSRTSVLFSSFIYASSGYSYDNPVCYQKLGSTLVGSMDIRTLMEVHGFEDIKVYDLDDEYQNGDTNSDVILCGYSDDDITEFAIGHHRVTYNGVTKEIVAVIVRGTNGTIEEWASNFDLGDPNKTDSDWNTTDNHRGFDVTSTRVFKYLQNYSETYLTSADAIYWVMGHSRGAAIANILSAMLIDNGEKVFGYTFAAPNTTISADANSTKYDSIFNLVNEDDFVPCVPMTAWNFVRYGQTATLDMTSNMENEWHSLLDKWWYNQLSKKNLDKLVGALADASSGSTSEKWENCYVYTCSHSEHGNSTADDITEKGINNINDIPYRVRQYCKYECYKNWYGGYEYQVCQLPAYFMQALADIITTSGGIFGFGNQAWKVLSTFQFADRYESARNKVISATLIGGIAHPHYCETYYLLTGYANASDFNDA